MVFTTTNLFKGIACPRGEQCRLTSCIFAHDFGPQGGDAEAPTQAQESSEEPANKRRKIITDVQDGSSSTFSKSEHIPPQKAASRQGRQGDQVEANWQALQAQQRNLPEFKQFSLKALTSSKEKQAARGTITPASKDRPEPSIGKSDQVHEQVAVDRQSERAPADRQGGLPDRPAFPPSLEKAVTPPPPSNEEAAREVSRIGVKNSGGQAQAVTKQTHASLKESLNPRLIPNGPVGHQTRMLLLKHMHAEMVRLNKALVGDQDFMDKRLYELDEQELTKLALDAEEALARSQSSLYPNKMKQRIAAYKKMDSTEWKDYVKILVFDTRAKITKKSDPDEKIITTGLSPDDECAILPHLVADQTNLAQHGYVTSPPTKAEAAEAQAAVETSKNIESCERCGARFQVFPERNEEGRLTSGGSCTFHSRRQVTAQKMKNDYNAAAKEPFYPCCNNPVGSVGCTTHESHVFKTSSPARLAAVLPFITTPENTKVKKDWKGEEVRAVSFDCEMGYTTCGTELIRLTAVSWPSGEQLVDVLVRPVGTVIDLNSRFSGVFPEHFSNAVPYAQWESDVPPAPAAPGAVGNSPLPQILPVVDSISQARGLLISYLTPTTPLIGHAIENDLNATRLVHPTIIDTVLLFRHHRGLPYRLALRALTLQHLGKSIQQGGDRGHDSAEDARATGELVRVKVAERWAHLERAGFVIEGGRLWRDDGRGGYRMVQSKRDARVWIPGDAGRGGKGKGKKRKNSRRDGMEGAAEESEETTDESATTEQEGKARNGIAAFLPQAEGT